MDTSAPLPTGARTASFSLLLATALAAGAAHAQERPRPPDGPAAFTAEAVRTEEPVVMDGVPDEASWRSAPVVTDLVQREPREGERASQATEVRLLYDEAALYVGAWLMDERPDGIVPGERVRDGDLTLGDAFLVVLDTFHDRQTGFLFGTNPLGVEYDGHITMDGHPGASGRFRESTAAGFNLNWNGSWSVATSRDGEGWYVEMRIPFSTLRFAGGEGASWGLNVGRYIRRGNEEAFWAPISRRHTIHRVSLAGTLRGMDLPEQRTLAVTPYVLQEIRRDFAPAGEPGGDPGRGVEYPADAGLDVKVGLTSSVTMDLTYNTDFAQVEADDERIDLTRFNLFFPEKRPFFLENAGLFTVGAPGWLELFYSRRIGIGPSGERIPIRGGGRVTGTVGSLSGGVLLLETEETSGVGHGNRYAVGRLQHRFRGNSRIGVMYTGRVSTAEASDDNHLLDVDGRVWLGESTFVEGYAAATRTPGLEGREHSFYVNLSHEGTTWLPRVSYMEAGDNFNPEVGFVSRVGFRVPTVSLQRRIRVPSVSWLREVRPELHWNGFWNLDDFLETHAASLRVRADLADGGSLRGSFSHTIEGLEEPFDIHPGVRVPAGSYENVEATLGFATDPSATVAVSGSVDAGGFFSGSRLGLSGTLAARRGAILSGGLRASFNRIRLPEGDFDTRLIGVRLGVFPTAALSLRALVQYSSQAEAWTGNVRVGWLRAAGTGLFVVYNHSRRTGERAGPLHRGLTVKYSRRFDLAW